MSNNTPLTDHERQGLLRHHLDVDKPSQMSDCFRLGIAWNQMQVEKQQAQLAKETNEYAEALYEMGRKHDNYSFDACGNLVRKIVQDIKGLIVK